MLEYLKEMLESLQSLVFGPAKRYLQISHFFLNRGWVDMRDLATKFSSYSYEELISACNNSFFGSEVKVRFTFRKEFVDLYYSEVSDDEVRSDYSFETKTRRHYRVPAHFVSRPRFTEGKNNLIRFFEDEPGTEISIAGIVYAQHVIYYGNMYLYSKAFFTGFLKYLVGQTKNKDADSSLQALGYRVEIFIPTPHGGKKRDSEKQSPQKYSPTFSS